MPTRRTLLLSIAALMTSVVQLPYKPNFGVKTVKNSDFITIGGWFLKKSDVDFS